VEGISKKWKDPSSALPRKRTWVQALPWFSTCSLGLPPLGTDLKSRKGCTQALVLYFFSFFFPLMRRPLNKRGRKSNESSELKCSQLWWKLSDTKHRSKHHGSLSFSSHPENSTFSSEESCLI
jgi:hypothetical protein